MPQPPLVPAPAAAAITDRAPFSLAAGTTIVGEPDAAAVLRAVIASRTGIPVSGDAAASPERTGTIRLAIGGDGPPESYRLRSDAASVSLVGADAAGLFYGMQTLAQLLVAPHGAVDGWTIPAAEIDDAPRFAYRGVMLDVARHFFDVTVVKDYIERAAALKFNVLHLHLTDDKGWRLQLRSHPELAANGSGAAVGGDAGGCYTREDYRQIIAHAAAHHMTVVPEIDLPGHTHAVSLSHPELCAPPVVTDEVREVVHTYGGGLPANGTAYTGMAVGFSSLRIHEEATYDFLADILGELAELTPGPYLHIGGDEALGTPAGDYDTFIGRVTALAAATGKTPMAWHEAGASASLAPGTVGQYWGFVSPVDGMDEKTRSFVARGGAVVMSPADAVYLDMKFAADSPLGLTWARGVTTVQRAYDWDAAAIIDGIDDDAILGVEAPLWTETVRTAADIDALAFPRIAAAAEAAWSPALGSTPLRTWESFRARLGGLGPLWERLGIRFTALPEIDWAHEQPAPQVEGNQP